MFYKKCLLVIASSLVLISAAHADRKNYTAAECVQRDSSGTLDYSVGGARISNAHATEHLTVVCPIVRDSISGSAVIEDASIIVLDPSEPDDVTCHLQVRRRTETGSGYWGYKQTRSTTGFSSDWQPLNFGNVGTNSDPNHIYHMYFECELPDSAPAGRYRIITYSVEE